jgi:hypothetical protein
MMPDDKRRQISERVGDRRADSEAYVDPEVAELFDEEQRKQNPEMRQQELGAESPEQPLDEDLQAGDVDVDMMDAAFVGEEAPGGGNPTPDMSVVDDLGKAVGLEYQDEEPLRVAEKLEKRDRHRWELDPASSEDFQERQ